MSGGAISTVSLFEEDSGWGDTVTGGNSTGETLTILSTNHGKIVSVQITSGGSGYVTGDLIYLHRVLSVLPLRYATNDSISAIAADRETMSGYVNPNQINGRLFVVIVPAPSIEHTLTVVQLYQLISAPTAKTYIAKDTCNQLMLSANIPTANAVSRLSTASSITSVGGANDSFNNYTYGMDNRINVQDIDSMGHGGMHFGKTPPNHSGWTLYSGYHDKDAVNAANQWSANRLIMFKLEDNTTNIW